MEKLTVSGSSNLKAQYKICVKKWKKNLLHLPKEKANFSKINEGGGDFSVENLSLFFQSKGKET